MKNTLKISLKPNEKIYVNGAVVKVDRKATIEFLNDVQFLLESHVLQLDRNSYPRRRPKRTPSRLRSRPPRSNC